MHHIITLNVSSTKMWLHFNATTRNMWILGCFDNAILSFFMDFIILYSKEKTEPVTVSNGFGKDGGVEWNKTQWLLPQMVVTRLLKLVPEAGFEPATFLMSRFLRPICLGQLQHSGK